MPETNFIAAPPAENEASRLAAVAALNVMYTPAEERFERVTRLACRLLDVPIATVTLIDADVQWFKARRGVADPSTSRAVSFCAHAILKEETLVVPDATADPRFAGNPLVIGEPFIRFYAGHPIHAVDGSRVGTLCIIDRKPRSLGASDLELLRDLAAWTENELRDTAMSAAQRALISARDALRRKAMLDSLTHLWNRQAILDVLDRELARGRREGEPVAVLMVDIDFFKRVNDRFGHLAGDAVLLETARRMRSALRSYDAIGRYGGEEFLAVLSRCSGADAVDIAEAVRARVAAEPVETAAGPIGVTLSLGVAATDAAASEHAEASTNGLALVAVADAALYRAKAGGRNRVESAEGAGTGRWRGAAEPS
jgi:diguanylate cyclase (GGDEF)-like protein